MVSLIKHFTIITYDPRVIWLENCPYYDSRVVIYASKMFIILATAYEPHEGLYIIIYDFRVIWPENCPYYNSRVVIYDHKMVIILATASEPHEAHV